MNECIVVMGEEGPEMSHACADVHACNAERTRKRHEDEWRSDWRSSEVRGSNMGKSERVTVQFGEYNITGTVIMVSEHYFVVRIDEDQPILAGRNMSF